MTPLMPRDVNAMASWPTLDTREIVLLHLDPICSKSPGRGSKTRNKQPFPLDPLVMTNIAMV